MIIKPIRSCLWAGTRVIASLGRRLNNVDLVWPASEAGRLAAGRPSQPTAWSSWLFWKARCERCRQPGPRAPRRPPGNIVKLNIKKSQLLFYVLSTITGHSYEDTGAPFIWTGATFSTSRVLLSFLRGSTVL